MRIGVLEILNAVYNTPWNQRWYAHFALKQNEHNNRNSSCIGCGVCVTACPMDVLSFGSAPEQQLVQIQARA